MSARVLILLSFVFSILAWPATAQWNNDAQKCATEGTSYKQKLHYCTLAIGSGQLSQVNLANTYFNRGVAFDSHGEFEHAIGDFTDAIRLKPEDADFYLSRGFVFLEIGDGEKALADFDQAVTLLPDDPGVFFNRAILKEELGDQQGALVDYKKAYELGPEDPEIAARAKELGLAP